MILNVKNTPSQLNFNTQTKLVYDDNGSIGANESHGYPNHLLWNFGDQSVNLTLNGCHLMGSVLNPQGTLRAGVNADGNLIAQTVDLYGGESHRWDLRGGQPKTVIPTKSDAGKSETSKSDTDKTLNKSEAPKSNTGKTPDMSETPKSDTGKTPGKSETPKPDTDKTAKPTAPTTPNPDSGSNSTSIPNTDWPWWPGAYPEIPGYSDTPSSGSTPDSSSQPGSSSTPGASVTPSSLVHQPTDPAQPTTPVQSSTLRGTDSYPTTCFDAIRWGHA
ncbi:choice-of-anchor A family protein [uncultured Limosilactobacillus sp.]|uniref:choice-of-anchor A family protein n=1 Tax=uncultured Limosilactobacillus sp. TaxID=2837629 RepID=UPI00338F4659